MNIIVLLKQVPDLVEDLEIAEDGKSLNREWIKLILSEPDDHALEQALVLKEKIGGVVRVFVLEQQEDNDLLYTAIAKGADSATKILGDFSQGVTSHCSAQAFHKALANIPFDMIITGSQAIDDFDGQMGAFLASYLNVPYVSVLSEIQLEESSRSVLVSKEFPGGNHAEISVQLPAVFGVQSAPQPPRYVPIAKIRQAMKTSTLDEIKLEELIETMQDGGIPVERQISVSAMFKPEMTGNVEFIEGTSSDIVRRLIDIFSEKGLVK